MIDRDSLIASSAIVPKEKRARFAKYLENLPRTPGLVSTPHKSEARLQGDILTSFPFCIIGPDGNFKSATLPVAVLNNTCDLQPKRSKFVNVCPVMDFAAYSRSVQTEKPATAASNLLRDVQQNEVAEMLYLETCPGFAAGAVIFLDRISTVSFELYETAIETGRRSASFTQNGFYILLLKITHYLARPDPSEIDREMPNDSTRKSTFARWRDRFFSFRAR